ncbi:MAG TPA: phosphate-starvation-inducible PsiE family protein [Methanomassiliicoccales archaeon]|nr:phosphate-starvation-inducible PsiE family protein [Methanomassiliicoccales archaeon]
MPPRSNDYLNSFTKVIIWILVVLLCLLALLAIIGTIGDLWDALKDPSQIRDIRESVLDFIGQILLVVVILELVDTIMVYAKEHIIRVGSVILVAITAVSRELIIFDYHNGSYLMLFGISAAIISLAAIFWVVSHLYSDAKNRSEAKDGV